MKISVEQLKQLNKEEYILIDIRDAEEAFKNPIENSIVLSGESALETEFDSTKKIIVVCAQGYVSDIVAQKLQEKYEAYSVDGGYVSIVMDKMNTNVSDDFCAQVERSIIKTYRRKIWSKFTKAIRDYELVKEGDCIAVCISGGKDSMLMAKCFQELHKHSPVPFDVKYIVMDPGYSKENREVIEKNAKKLNIPVEIFESDIFDNVFNIEKNPCYICARMRRGYLYSKAKELGCNKIALGHHFDDVVETILLSMFYASEYKTMMPKLHSENFPGMELIRPLYLIREADIIHWRDYNNLAFIQCACRLTESCASCGGTEKGSKRGEIKQLIKDLTKVSPYIEKNIFRSVENVNLDTVIAYKQYGVKHNFLERYDEMGRLNGASGSQTADNKEME